MNRWIIIFALIAIYMYYIPSESQAQPDSILRAIDNLHTVASRQWNTENLQFKQALSESPSDDTKQWIGEHMEEHAKFNRTLLMLRRDIVRHIAEYDIPHLRRLGNRPVGPILPEDVPPRNV